MDSEPTFQSEPSVQPPVHASPMASSSVSQSAGFVTTDQLTAISDKWAEQFARMEALLSRGNIFSTPVSAVKPVDSQHLISDTPFLVPATRPTGPVQVPVAVDAQAKTTHRNLKNFLNKCQMLILRSQTPCPVQMKDNYLIPLKLQSKPKI